MVYNVGIIGYGLSAKIFHIPFVIATDKFRLHAVVQRSPKPQDDASQDHPGIKSYRSTEELVKDGEVDLVIVTTTPETHVELATLALKAKKHVLVEKPFTPTSAEAQQLVDLARENGVLLTVYQNRRYDADFLLLREQISANTLGRVVEFESHFDRHRPDMPAVQTWKTVAKPGVSVVYDLGSHLMDQVVCLYGLPQKVTGFVGSQRGSKNTSDVADSCTILLHYADLLATVKAGVVSPEPEQLRFWIKGEKGSFRKHHLDPQEDQLKAGLRPGESGYGEESSDRAAVLNTVREGGRFSSQRIPALSPPRTYVAFYKQLAEALDKNDPALLPVDPAQAVGLIRLIELAHQSSKEERTLIV